MRKKLPVLLHQLSNFSSGLGNSIATITISWLILEKTDSPAFAGLVAAISAVPGLLISPIGGWLVDHLGRRAVSISADLLSSLSVMAFPVVAATAGLNSSSILIIALAGAIFDPAGYTARKTLITNVSETAKVDLDKLNGIHEGFLGVSWIFGPAIGAGLISTIGSENTFWVAGGLFIVAALCVALLRIDKSEHLSTDEEKDAKQDKGLKVGFTVLWNDKLLRTITFTVLIIAAVYLPTETVILPTHFERLNEPGEFGVIISALAGGSAIGAFGYGWLIKRMRRKTLVRMVLIGVAISMIPMAIFPPLPIMLIAGFFLGLSWGPFNPLISSLIQQRVPSEQHGRVFGVQTAVFYAAPPLGMVLTGLAVEEFGVNATYIFLAAVLSLTALLALFTKSLRSHF